MKHYINKILGVFDCQLVRKSSLEKQLENSRKYQLYEVSRQIEEKYWARCFENIDYATSQLGQDLLVLGKSGFKRDGYFVEFGACDGVLFSNSHLLEKRFGWSGILAEPDQKFHACLKKNRTANIETNCVWKTTGTTLTFNETKQIGLSTLDQFSNSDKHKKSRKNGSLYEVLTISLSDMLEKYNAPHMMDYLSIDTEGSELDILQSLNFQRYRFKIITCEHNNTSNREKIYALLTKQGYTRILTSHSQFDDWYVLPD